MANQISTSTVAWPTSGASPNVLAESGQMLAVANNGDVLAVWFDGTNVKWSYAASGSYSSWATATLIASLGAGPRWQTGLYYDSASDQAVVVTSDAAGDMVSYIVSHTASTHTWSVGTQHTVEAGASNYSGGTVAIDKDAFGRYWAVWTNGSNAAQVYYSANGTSWTASTTITVASGDTAVWVATVGNYTVVAYCQSTSTLVYYTRAQTNTSTIGGWSTGAQIPTIFADNVAQFMMRGVGGSSTLGIFVTNEATSTNGICAMWYDSSTDTWQSSVSTLGSSRNDTDVCLTSDGTNLYLLWCLYSAANNYSLVYRKWTASSKTWDASNTTLEASGTNIRYPSAAYNASLLAFIYTLGTVTPWGVEFDSKSFSSGGTFSATPDTLTLADAVSATGAETPAADALAVSETPGGLGAVSLADPALTVAEGVPGGVGTAAPAADLLTLTDAGPVASGGLTLADALSITESAAGASGSSSVATPTDGLTLAESPVAAIGGTVLPADVLTLAESVTSQQQTGYFVVPDVLTLADAVTVSGALAPQVPDVLTPTDTALAAAGAMGIMDLALLLVAEAQPSGAGSAAPPADSRLATTDAVAAAGMLAWPELLTVSASAEGVALAGADVLPPDLLTLREVFASLAGNPVTFTMAVTAIFADGAAVARFADGAATAVFASGTATALFDG